MSSFPLLLLFLVLLANCRCYPVQRVIATDGVASNDSPSLSEVPKVRTKRGIFWDFFQKVVTTKNLVVDQYVDTRNTLNEVYNFLNDGFSDPAPKKPTISTSTTEKSTFFDDDETTTSTEPYSISRYELGRILGRNFRGLQNLAKLEFQDALNQSYYNVNEYKAEADKQFANSLVAEKKFKVKQLAMG